MRRLMRDALLVAATAACVWFVRGEAQEDYTVVYGVPMQVICTGGRIENAEMSQAALDRVTLTWRTGIAPQSICGNANLTRCVLYPDLRTPAP